MQYLSCGRRALYPEGWGNASREAEGDDAESVLPKRSSDAEETEREGGTESGVEREGGERERFLACKETAERKIAFCVLLRCWCCSSCVICLGAETSKQAKCYQHAIISSGSRKSRPLCCCPSGIEKSRLGGRRGEE